MRTKLAVFCILYFVFCILYFNFVFHSITLNIELFGQIINLHMDVWTIIIIMHSHTLQMALSNIKGIPLLLIPLFLCRLGFMCASHFLDTGAHSASLSFYSPFLFSFSFLSGAIYIYI